MHVHSREAQEVHFTEIHTFWREFVFFHEILVVFFLTGKITTFSQKPPNSVKIHEISVKIAKSCWGEPPGLLYILWTRPSFFWYDNDKDLKVGFLMTRVRYWSVFHGCLVVLRLINTISITGQHYAFDWSIYRRSVDTKSCHFGSCREVHVTDSTSTLFQSVSLSVSVNHGSLSPVLLLELDSLQPWPLLLWGYLRQDPPDF